MFWSSRFVERYVGWNTGHIPGLRQALQLQLSLNKNNCRRSFIGRHLLFQKSTAPAAFAAMCLEQGSATLRLAQDKQSECEILSQNMDQ